MIREWADLYVPHLVVRGARRGIALVALAALALALAGPLLGPGIGADLTYCCRSGRCCCDSGQASPDHLDLKTACRCARPGGMGLVFSVPPMQLEPETALAAPEPGESTVPRPDAEPQDGMPSPLDPPPKLSRT